MPRESRERPVNFPRENHHTCGNKLALAGTEQEVRRSQHLAVKAVSVVQLKSSEILCP